MLESLKEIAVLGNIVAVAWKHRDVKKPVCACITRQLYTGMNDLAINGFSQ
jgi:hypothetical protein